MDRRPLDEWNPHWHGGPVSPRVLKHPVPRAVVPHWVEELLHPREGMWNLKAGPRQVGKTTSLGHVVQRLVVDRSIDPRRVSVVPLDDEVVQQASGGSLEAVIQAATGLHAPTPQEPSFLLLDEVQAFPDWAAKLKSAWDRHHLTVRVLATGSSALRLLRPADADFHGRIRTVTVHPMKFREVLEAHPDTPKHADASVLARMTQHVRAVRQAFLQGPEPLGAAMEELDGFLHAHSLAPFLHRLWLEYCAWGGYPATRPGAPASPQERLDRFEGAFNTVLARDVVHGGIRKLREFRLLFRQVCMHPGGRFEPYGAGRRLQVAGSVVQEWKRILEDVMLVQQLEPLKPNLLPDHGRDKAYPTDPGWISYFRGHTRMYADADDPFIGALAETVLVDHVRRLRFNLQGTTALPIGYMARPEVDVAADLGPRWLLVEAKYSSRPRVDLRGVGGEGDVRVVATRDHFEPGARGGVCFVPAELLALVC